MNGKAFLAIASFCLLASSASGYTMDLTQTMDREGTARMEVAFDISAETGNLSETCAKFLSQTRWKSSYCSAEGNRAVMRGTVSLKNTPYYVVRRSVPYNTYTYDEKAVYLVLSDYMGYETNLTAEEINRTASKAMPKGIQVNYAIEMPGEIVKADAWAIRDNKVESNTLSLAGSGRSLVESRELNTSWIIGLVSFIPIMLFVSYVAGRKQKKRDY